MDISIRYNWSDKKDWEYKELFDESVVEKKDGIRTGSPIVSLFILPITYLKATKKVLIFLPKRYLIKLC